MMQMGKWYTIEAQAIKVHRHDFGDGFGGFTNYGEQMPFDAMWDRRPLEKPVQAMYIGNRDVYCGDWIEDTYWDDDLERDMPAGFTRFMRRYQHRVYLFVLNERQNPIYVFPNDVIEYNWIVAESKPCPDCEAIK